MSFLRIWRKSSQKTQAEFAMILGENHKTYSAYERGASPIPPETMAKLRAMGYGGPSDQHLTPEHVPLTRADFLSAFENLHQYLEAKQGAGKGHLSGSMGMHHLGKIDVGTFQILPEHVQEAWVILAEAFEKSGAKLHFVDRKAFGLLVGLTAAEIAQKGLSGRTKTRLLSQAEEFVRPSTRSR